MKEPRKTPCSTIFEDTMKVKTTEDKMIKENLLISLVQRNDLEEVLKIRVEEHFFDRIALIEKLGKKELYFEFIDIVHNICNGIDTTNESRRIRVNLLLNKIYSFFKSKNT